MEKTRKRLKFKCWQCGRSFSLLKEFEGAPKLIVPCPFCSTTCIANLAPFSRKTVEVMRNDSPAQGSGITLDLPEVIPTGKSPEKDQD